MLHRRRIYRSGLRADTGNDPVAPTPGTGKPADPGGGNGRGNSGGRGGGRGDPPASTPTVTIPVAPTFQSLGSAGGAGVTGTATVNYPSSKPTGHVVLAAVVLKPHTLTPTDLAAPWSPWVTKAGGDPADAHGADTGRTRMCVAWRQLGGGEGASEAVTLSAAGDPWLTNMLRYSGVDLPAIATTTGEDVTDGNAYTVVMAADPGLKAGDKVVVLVARPADTGSYNGAALTVPGCTVSAGTYRLTGGTAAGLDAQISAVDFDVTADTSTGPATFTENVVAAPTLGAGPAVLVRLRPPT